MSESGPSLPARSTASPAPLPPSAATEAGDLERRPFLVVLGALATVLAAARLVGREPLLSYLAGVVLVCVPFIGLRVLSGRRSSLFFLAAALGTWVAFRPGGGAWATASFLVQLVHRIAYFAVPPLVLDLVLTERDRVRFKLGPVHIFAPAAVMAVAMLTHLALRGGVSTAESEVRTAAAAYSFCYAALVALAFVVRVQTESAKATAVAAPIVTRAVELEEQGRYGLASRAYEREGEAGKAAETAERAGDWARAGRMFQLAGNDFQAGEMFYRAQMWPEALQGYERARALPAAARLCLQLGQVDRAVALYEQVGDPGGVVRALEEAGRRPTPDQYRKAGRRDRAAAVFEESGEWVRAAEIYEHELLDPERAAAAYLKGGSFVQAGRLLESRGRRQDALEAFAAVPEGALDAARLYLAAGHPREAADIFAQVSAAALDKMEDEVTLTQLARAMVESGRNDEALRLLQRLKRRGVAGGTVHLLLGRAFHSKKLGDLAEQELRTASSLPLDPADELQAAYLLGCVLEEGRKDAEALRIFNDLMQKQFHYADVQQRYRRLKAKTPNPDRAPNRS